MESLGASVLLVADRLGVYDATVGSGSTEARSRDVVGPAADAVAGASSVLVVAAVLAVWLAFARRRPEPARLAVSFAAGVAAVLAFGKVLRRSTRSGSSSSSRWPPVYRASPRPRSPERRFFWQALVPPLRPALRRRRRRLARAPAQRRAGRLLRRAAVRALAPGYRVEGGSDETVTVPRRYRSPSPSRTMSLVSLEEALAAAPSPRPRQAAGQRTHRGRVRAGPWWPSPPAAVDLPPFAASAMDGYAVRSEDPGEVPGRVPDRCRHARAGPAGARQGMAIATGGAVPEGADAVVPIEHVEERNDALNVPDAVQAGANVRPRGGHRRGKRDRARGHADRPAQIGALAAAGVGACRARAVHGWRS